MFVCARDIVARTSDFDILAQNMTLRPWQWEMLHSFDDRTSLGAIARRIGVDLASITESLSALEQHGLIKIRTVTREEYRRVFEMASPGTVAPAPHGVDDDDDFPVAKAGAGRNAGSAAQAGAANRRTAERPARGTARESRAGSSAAAAPRSNTVPFQGQAAPHHDRDRHGGDGHEVGRGRDRPGAARTRSAAGFSTQLADLKARLDEVLVPAAEPEAEAPPAAPASQPLSRGGLADFTDALTGHSTETVAEAPRSASTRAAGARARRGKVRALPAATSVNGKRHRRASDDRVFARR